MVINYPKSYRELLGLSNPCLRYFNKFVFMRSCSLGHFGKGLLSHDSILEMTRQCSGLGLLIMGMLAYKCVDL